jgi:hypothetical protein
LNKKSALIFFFITIISYSLYAQQSKVWTFLPDGGSPRYILDQPVNIRNEPNLNGRIIGQLQLDDSVFIKEKTNNLQEIDNVLAYWYKIKKDDIEGYIFGGYIAEKRFKYIDRNGTIYNFFNRISGFDGDWWEIDGINDIIIYVNGRKISTDDFKHEYGRGGRKWSGCHFAFSETKETALIILKRSAPVGDMDYYFRIDRNGTIKFKERIFSEY